MSGSIKCLFFSEFHTTAGPKVTYQFPESFPLKEAFDLAHEYIITKPQLYDRLMTVTVMDYVIMGCPRGITDKKYDRNTLIFNFGFVFDKDCDTVPFESVVRKLGATFRIYELENGFLSDNVRRGKLPGILAQMFNELNHHGMCSITIDDVNILNLKITPMIPSPPPVCHHQVPIFVCSASDVEATKVDLTLQQIVPYIDGFNHILKISQESDVDVGIVSLCVQHLYVYGYIKLISIFQYCNIYVPTPNIRRLLEDATLQTSCLEYVAIPGCRPKLKEVFQLYCSLEPGLTIKDLCNRHEPSKLGVDERHLIQFGLTHDLVHHCKKYPTLLRTDEPMDSTLQPLAEYLDGLHDYDEICCALGWSHQTVDNIVENSDNVVVHLR
ncbi:GATOR1 complex protein NPRL2-like isoform X2 [Dysidea avara]|uniref:GATOR1 complex protein NPRL2-like isoform X2 n=1 Tax=Dysidea avara TaxID=196820 RepID=UPI003327BA7B